MPKQRSVRTDERTRTEPSKSERTRERILDAAAKVLNRNGYAGTRLSDIAELAQVQAPALYYYFSSREELIEEVVTLGMARALEHVTEALAALPADASRLDRISAAVGAHLEVVLRLSDYASAAIRNGPQLPTDLRERQLVEQRTYGDVWRRLIDEARAAGEIHPDLDPRAARMLIIGGLNWATEWWNPNRGSLRTVINTAKLLTRQGLAAPVTD
ncbi:MAG: TetR/AcrR family transcriptional regulator, cholesterol catabolism regulator [Pseudonocardiales bacterium]|nr:TetR/AcrR family transcriptional regulator, cholesterol catabolism regulator [Pseudonocardiales bacterium]